jgi:hypothetical protein
MKCIFGVATILIGTISLVAQHPASRIGQGKVYVNKSRPSVYITLERVGQLESPDPGDDKERVWLRLHNNTRFPLRLNMGAVPTSEYGDAKLFVDGLLNDEVIFRIRCHSCSTNMLVSGRSLIFSVPCSDLGPDRSIRVRFSYGWEDWRDVTAGREPEHYVYFYSSQLPKSQQQNNK